MPWSQFLALYGLPAAGFVLTRALAVGVFRSGPSASLLLGAAVAYVLYAGGRAGWREFFRFEEFGWQFDGRSRKEFCRQLLPFTLVLLAAAAAGGFLAFRLLRHPVFVPAGVLLAGLFTTRFAKHFFASFAVRRGTELITQEEAERVSEERFSRG